MARCSLDLATKDRVGPCTRCSRWPDAMAHGIPRVLASSATGERIFGPPGEPHCLVAFPTPERAKLNHTISRLASGPRVGERPCRIAADHAWPVPCRTYCSSTDRPEESVRPVWIIGQTVRRPTLAQPPKRDLAPTVLAQPTRSSLATSRSCWRRRGTRSSEWRAAYLRMRRRRPLPRNDVKSEGTSRAAP